MDIPSCGWLTSKIGIFTLRIARRVEATKENIPDVMKRNIIIKRDSKIYKIVVFDVLTAVVMKSIMFWDTTPCSPLYTALYPRAQYYSYSIKFCIFVCLCFLPSVLCFLLHSFSFLCILFSFLVLFYFSFSPFSVKQLTVTSRE
jgi:hypothetical protein